MHRVDYNGLVADVLEEHLQEGIRSLSECSRAERRQILHSVEKALDAAQTRLKAGQPLSEQDRQNIADDIGLWFADQVMRGKADDYKVAV